MAAEQFYLPFPTAFTSNGFVAPGAKIYFYATDTTTPAAIYTDAGLTTEHANPVVADGAGRFATIYMDSTVTYRVDIKDSADVALTDPVDPYIPGATNAAVSIGSSTIVSTIAALKGLATPSDGDTAYLTASLKEGWFVFRSGDYSADVTADTQEGVYVKATDTAATVGAWERVHNNDIWLTHFGFDSANSAADNKTALQAILDFATHKYNANEGVWKQHWWGWEGTAEVSGPALGVNFSGGTFSLVTYDIEGGAGYATAASSVIKLTDPDQALLILQNNRGTRIHGLYLQGQIPTTPTTAQVVQDDSSPWFDPSGTISDNQYAPHCGISIDPFSNDSTSANQYTGLSAYYTQNVGSNTVDISHCTFFGFTVGIGWNTSRYSPQGDGMTSNTNKFLTCKVTHAVGQSQSRACSIRDIFVNHCTTMVDCTNYGQTIGNFPEVFGGQCTIAKQVFIADGARNSAQITGLYLEEVWRIGKWSGNIFPMTINSVQAKLMTPSTLSIPAPDAVLEADGPVNFNGGSIYINDAKKHDMSVFATTLVSFNSTSLNGYIMGGQAANADGKFSFHDCPLKAHTSGASYGLSDNLGPCRVGIFSSESIATKGRNSPAAT